MSHPSYAVTFACYNQLDYTRQCVDSLVRTGFDLSRLVVVDNGSTDGTRAYLEALPAGARILNQGNLGCGVAWNQGALALQAEWTVVMNNDVVVSAGWLEGLLEAARKRGLRVVSPAMVEGTLDYDFDVFAGAAAKTRDTLRPGARHAVCMAIHRNVWQEVGYFQAVPKLWGYEDTLFFHELDKAGIASGITGNAWLHHFGSVTLSALKQERGLSGKQGLSARNSHQLLGQSFLQRKWKKMQRLRREARWRADELAAHGMTLHGQREGGAFSWR
ncbi:MAG TPA: glycosyltransferase [Ramlibacter sp.]|nr:glycosyltransferase [Ramlibacter sp.]